MTGFIFSIWIALQIIIGYNLILPFLLFLIWIATKSARTPRLYQDAQVPEGAVQHEPDYAIIVTAYQQTDSIPAVVNSLLNLNYTNFLVYIVADNCDTSKLNFDDARVILLRPPFVLQSNTRSHFYAISHFQRPHSHLTIIDSDNLVHPEYLNELNSYFGRGFKAVQGVRKAKNLNTTYACLDAARDIYYHFYDGRVLFELGSSATLSGSGMAFTTSLYEECLGKLDIQGAGFDKVLQNEIVKRGNRIAFAEKAIVLDEKTSRPEQLVNQRSRWINTWFRYFTFGFSLAARGIAHLNLNQFLFGIILLRPPLFIFLLLSVACLLINIWISAWVTMGWMAGILLFITGFIISLRMSETDRKIYKSLYSIPKFVYFQILSLLHSRSANRRSVATTHYYSGMSDDNQRKENHES